MRNSLMTTTIPSRVCSISILGLLCCVLLVGSATTGLAQITPTEESLSDLYPGKAYSPYAERSFPDRVFWGDTLSTPGCRWMPVCSAHASASMTPTALRAANR